jgi:hypothetical protein
LLVIADRPKTIIANYTGDRRDSDNDGLLNYEELHIYGTSIYQVDTDNDGLTDYQEVKFGWNPLLTDREIVDAVYEMKKMSGGSPYTTSWFFTPEFGWMYTISEIFPYIYLAKTNSWVYFQSGNHIPRFYDYDKKKWFIQE